MFNPAGLTHNSLFEELSESQTAQVVGGAESIGLDTFGGSSSPQLSALDNYTAAPVAKTAAPTPAGSNFNWMEFAMQFVAMGQKSMNDPNVQSFFGSLLSGNSGGNSGGAAPKA